MFIYFKDVYVNSDQISILAVKGDTLVVDLAYNRADGEPVFLSFRYDSEEEAKAVLEDILRYLNENA